MHNLKFYNFIILGVFHSKLHFFKYRGVKSGLMLTNLVRKEADLSMVYLFL